MFSLVLFHNRFPDVSYMVHGRTLSETSAKVLTRIWRCFVPFSQNRRPSPKIQCTISGSAASAYCLIISQNQRNTGRYSSDSSIGNTQGIRNNHEDKTDCVCPSFNLPCTTQAIPKRSHLSLNVIFQSGIQRRGSRRQSEYCRAKYVALPVVVVIWLASFLYCAHLIPVSSLIPYRLLTTSCNLSPFLAPFHVLSCAPLRVSPHLVPTSSHLSRPLSHFALGSFLPVPS